MKVIKLIAIVIIVICLFYAPRNGVTQSSNDTSSPSLLRKAKNEYEAAKLSRTQIEMKYPIGEISGWIVENEKGGILIFGQVNTLVSQTEKGSIISDVVLTREGYFIIENPDEKNLFHDNFGRLAYGGKKYFLGRKIKMTINGTTGDVNVLGNMPSELKQAIDREENLKRSYFKSRLDFSKNVILSNSNENVINNVILLKEYLDSLSAFNDLKIGNTLPGRLVLQSMSIYFGGDRLDAKTASNLLRDKDGILNNKSSIFKTFEEIAGLNATQTRQLLSNLPQTINNNTSYDDAVKIAEKIRSNSEIYDINLNFVTNDVPYDKVGNIEKGNIYVSPKDGIIIFVVDQSRRYEKNDLPNVNNAALGINRGDDTTRNIIGIGYILQPNILGGYFSKVKKAGISSFKGKNIIISSLISDDNMQKMGAKISGNCNANLPEICIYYIEPSSAKSKSNEAYKIIALNDGSTSFILSIIVYDYRYDNIIHKNNYENGSDDIYLLDGDYILQSN